MEGNEKVYENIQDEIAYYKAKYTKYKEKYKVYVEQQTKLRKEFSELKNQHEILTDELNAEKSIRKKFEGKVIQYMKYDHLKDSEKYRQIDQENKEKINTNANVNTNMNDNLNEKDKKIKNYNMDSNSDNNMLYRIEVSDKFANRNDDYFNRESGAADSMNFFRSSEVKKEDNFNTLFSSSVSSIDNRDKDKETLTDIHQNLIKDTISDSNLPSSNLNERTLKEITNKFDIEKLKRSLTIDFIEFEKDTIAIRRKMFSREEKLNKLEKVLKIWVEISDNLRRSLENVINTMGIFNENLVQEPLDIFEECPDLISLVYTLQSVVSDLINQFKIFSVSIENSFVNQLRLFLNQVMQELRESKQSVVKHTDEFNYVSSKFLSTKKNYIKDSMRDNYMSQYKLLEFTRYDFTSKINQCLLFTKIELPEKVSLLIYAFMSLFRQGNDILNKIEYNVNANLEKVSVKHREKEKIIDEIKINKKELIKSFDNVNTSIQSKEGFLYVKLKDSNEYFKKRYFKIHNGNLIYFKMKKGTEQIDLTKHFILCNLILSNAKRNEKEYEFPFCFELISATNKKSFLLQGETDKETEEWVCGIRNAIANSISVYKNESPKKENINESIYMSYDSFTEKDKKDNIIDKLITSTKCTDCESESPTWCAINWLCLICIDCSGVHRSLGVQISKIRSLRLDNLEPELIELIDIMGQDKINAVLEAAVKSYEKPKPNSMYNEKEAYIANKYKNKKYLKLPPINSKGSSNTNAPLDVIYASSIFKFIDSDGLINIYHHLKLDLCDINKLYDCEKEKYSFLHHSAKKGKINSFKLLILLGAEIQLPDAKNLKPIDYATIYKNSEIADFIVKKLDELK